MGRGFCIQAGGGLLYVGGKVSSLGVGRPSIEFAEARGGPIHIQI